MLEDAVSSVGRAPAAQPTSLSRPDPFLNHYVLLVTFSIAVVAWFTAFIAMAVGEAMKPAVVSALTSLPLYNTLVRQPSPAVTQPQLDARS